MVGVVDPWVCDILGAIPINAPVLIPTPHRVYRASRGGGTPICACMNAPSLAGSFRAVPGSHHHPCNVRTPMQKLGLAYYSGRKQARVVLCAKMHEENVCYCLNMR